MGAAREAAWPLPFFKGSAMDPLELLLDYRALTSMYVALPSIQELFFTNEFFTPLLGPKSNVDSDTVEMISIGGTTRPGPGNLRGGTARRITPKGGTKRYFQLFRYFTEMEIDGDVLRSLREPDSEALQEKGQQAIDLQQEEMAIRHRLYKEVVLSQIMSIGRVNIDANGEILVPSVNSTSGAITDASGTAVSADFGVADSHRGNLGGTVSALWSTAATKISQQLDEIVRLAGIAGAPRPKTIYVNAIKKQVLRNNTEFNDWAKYNSTKVDQILAGDGIDGLWGFNWRFVEGTWTDKDGTTRDLIPQTSVIITPEKGPWLRAHNGSELVPRDLSPAPDARSLLNQLEKVYGPFTYASLNHNPVKLSMFYGDNFGLNFADPNALWCPTVFS